LASAPKIFIRDAVMCTMEISSLTRESCPPCHPSSFLAYR